MSIVLSRGPKNDECCIVSDMATHPAPRVLARVNTDEPGCWIWPGSKTKNGYGNVMTRPPYVEKPRPLLVHRVTYEWFIAPIPEGMDLDHLCRNRACCNPTHLEPVSRQVNSQRGSKYRPSQCVHGHPYPEHMKIRKNGYAMCRTCDLERQRERRKRGNRPLPRS